MKPKILQPWKARLFPPGRKQRRGVAILTVLAIITLMTILVISFFNMSQTHQTTSKGTVELQRVNTIRDTIINLVIAQVREATTLEGRSATDMVVWTSQPGAIRTYNRSNTSLNKLYKLYSSNEPQLDGITTFNTGGLLNSISEDLVTDWDKRPDEWVDLNRPVFTAASGSRAVDAKKDQEHFSYPIADPRRWNGNENDLTTNTEGFRYSSSASGKTMNGVSPEKIQLALPVRWVYILRDGSLGYLDSSGEFAPLTGKKSIATETNPIVGRMAWWADDESCKINVNTASVPSLWDVPRTTSLEDQRLMALRQPLSGEFQRYPGHPATTDISAALFPGKRFTPDRELAPVGPTMIPMDLQKEAKLIWDLAPYVSSGEGEPSNGGTLGGTQDRPLSPATVGLQTGDHIYTSFDELYFKAVESASGGGGNPKQPRTNLLSAGLDSSKEFLTRLEQSQFFLTHKSHSPETTMHGFPRIQMFPMHTDVDNQLKQKSPQLTTNLSPYDLTLAINSTIGGKSYFFLRSDPTARHHEFYGPNSSDIRVRNSRIMGYLKELTKIPIPGYPETKEISGLGSFTEDKTSLAAKYSSVKNPRNGNRFADAPAGPKPPGGGVNLRLDASDRTQILLSMLDYTRSINMNPPLATSKYDAGDGQSTGLCGCGIVDNPSGLHSAALNAGNTTTIHQRIPKGFGRVGGPAEITMIVNIAAYKLPDGTTLGDGGQAGRPFVSGVFDDASRVIWNATAPYAGTRYVVEVGFVMSSFTPKLGWSPIYPAGGTAVGPKGTTSAPFPAYAVGVTPAAMATQLPLRVQLSPTQTVFLGADGDTKFGAVDQNTHPRSMPGGGTVSAPTNGLLPAGGLVGPRATLKSGIALCKPFVVVGTAGAGSVGIPITPDSSGDRRLCIYALDGAAGEGNVISQVDLEMPVNFGPIGITPLGNPRSLRNLTEIGKLYGLGDASTQNAGFPGPDWATRSWVLPHGDYRLPVAAMRSEQGMFVYMPPPPGGNGQYSHSWWEPNANLPSRQIFGAQYSSDMYLFDDEVMSKYGRKSDLSAGMGPFLPFPALTTQTLKDSQKILPVPNSFVGKAEVSADLQRQASLEQQRRAFFFSNGREDDSNFSVMRGSSDPSETGDFDNGIGDFPDGPYLNWPDEGDVRQGNGRKGYFGTKAELTAKATKTAGQAISPNLLIRSPVDFGSIPTGVQARVPWQTLRFRPDTGMEDRTLWIDKPGQAPPMGMPFANFCGPRDHFFLDLFWMPVVEPWSISEPFSTKGTINLNQQIFPFLYVKRTTGLHALLRGERMTVIPNTAVDRYKQMNNTDPTYRHFINAKETVRQFEMRYEGKGLTRQGTTVENLPAFNTYRSASEICETWLVPEMNSPGESAQPWTLEYTMGLMPSINQGVASGLWKEHKITGDNSREAPYSNLYPRVTTRSNVFRVHMVAQALQKAKSNDPTKFDSTKDAVTGEWRGSSLIERSVDSNDPELRNTDYLVLDANDLSPTRTPRVDRFYIYRVTELKQLTE